MAVGRVVGAIGAVRTFFNVMVWLGDCTQIRVYQRCDA
jgi:hypothetical protein